MPWDRTADGRVKGEMFVGTGDAGMGRNSARGGSEINDEDNK